MASCSGDSKQQPTKHEWFQREDSVTLSIVKRGVARDDCHIVKDTDTSALRVLIKDEEVWAGELFGPVDWSRVQITATNARVEIKLPKASPGQWTSLTAAANSAKSSKQPAKNWDKMEKDAVREEESEQLEGDAAVQKLFRDIYANASEETKRAMLKSYQESAGTVLSTNWSEVGARKTEIKPPDSMEFKKWES